MAITPLTIMILSVLLTAFLTVGVVKCLPKLSRYRVIGLTVAPISILFLIYLIRAGAFRGSPDDFEGLTRALAPVLGTIIFGLQCLFAAGASAAVLSLARPNGGDGK